MEILAARYLLPIASDPIFQGALVVDGDRIVEVGPQKDILKKYPDRPVRKFDQHALLPGLINAHTCLSMSLFDTEDISNSYIAWETEALKFRRGQSAVKRRSAILEGLQRQLAAGTTLVADTGNYSGILETVKDVGLRLVIAPEIAGVQQGEESSYEDAFELIDEIHEQGSDRLLTAVTAHSPYGLSRHLLKIVAQLSVDSDMPLLIRAARSFAEMEFFFESKGEIADVFFPQIGWEDQLPPAHHKTPIQYLESIGFMATRPCLIGAIHLSEQDIATIARTAGTVIHTPGSARYFDLGLAPIKKLRTEKVAVALGTGGLGAATSLTLWDEMRAAYKTHGAVTGEALSADTLLQMATFEGAKVLGYESRLGSLEPNKQADFIVVETNSRLPIEKVPLTLINETTPDRIAKVFVAGQELK